MHTSSLIYMHCEAFLRKRKKKGYFNLGSSLMSSNAQVLKKYNKNKCKKLFTAKGVNYI